LETNAALLIISYYFISVVVYRILDERVSEFVRLKQ
jgi:hypothetical protein